ncbi:MAG: hypothetical protein CM15mP128_4740 [Methanobacteriota archaeon]|nr:MAG: hypothetical protein CM15mP128_4740 [Euryarchaeota archaeon]
MRGKRRFPLWYHPLTPTAFTPKHASPGQVRQAAQPLTTNAPHGAFNVRTPNAIQREVLHLAHDATYVEAF